jgi:hypothetical protein
MFLELAVEANMSVANVKGQLPGRSHKVKEFLG